jgi:hypothetical protein
LIGYSQIIFFQKNQLLEQPFQRKVFCHDELIQYGVNALDDIRVSKITVRVLIAASIAFVWTHVTDHQPFHVVFLQRLVHFHPANTADVNANYLIACPSWQLNKKNTVNNPHIQIRKFSVLHFTHYFYGHV